jgi:hypothetical protein
MAEFDNCARANGVWIGFDQGEGRSRMYGGTYHIGNIYGSGFAMGNLSFGTKHMDGTYSDHAGVSTAEHHDAADTVLTSFHAASNHPTSYSGMDLIISKTSEAGVPSPVVFAADVSPHSKEVDGATVTGRTYVSSTAVVGFPDATNDHVLAAAVSSVGDLNVPMADGTTKVLENPKTDSYDYNGVVMKVDMATGKALWATNEEMTSPAGRQYAQNVAVTTSGDVVVSGWLRSGAGRLAKYDGATGTNTWMVEFEEFTNGKSPHMDIKVVGETAYVTGAFEGADITKFGGTLTSCNGGADSSAFVASFDVSGTTAPTTANWIKLIGCGVGAGITVSGTSLFVAGELAQDGVASALTPASGVEAAKCTMAGGLNGYLAQLNQANGACVWAKDAAKATGVVTDGTHVWTAASADSALKFSETVTLATQTDDDQIFAAKYVAATGVGLWAAQVGGTGDTAITSYGGDDIFVSPAGPVIVGTSKSHHIELGDVKANNLQHQRSETPNPGGSAGEETMLMIQLSETDKAPSCISKCDSGKVDAAMEVTSGLCYHDGICLANGESPASLPCFECKAAVSQLAAQGPNTANHCFISGKCIPSGEGAPYYFKYNSDSVCEQCDPVVSPDGWSLKPGFLHDRVFAETLDGSRGSPEKNRGGLIRGQNNYGMIFQKNTGGCQIMPEIPMPASPSSNLNAALADPTLSTTAAVGARFTSAFAMVDSATKDNQGAEIVAAWYHANPTTCTRAADFCPASAAGGPGTGACAHSDVCAHTPAAHADEMAAAFDTNLYYGHSVARVKVMQALAILGNDLATGTTTANMADIKKDILAHMLIPMYQGAILSAHKMDAPDTAAAGLADFATYWNIIKDKVAFEANDKARLEALAVATAASGTNNLCTVKALLHRHLPDGSKLLYTHDWIPCPDGKRFSPCAGAKDITHAKDVTGAHHLKAAANFSNDDGLVEAVHLSATDIGILKASGEVVCTFQPPSPPPRAVNNKETSSGATVVLKLTASGSVSDYSDTKDLQEKIATAAGVASSLVTISVAAASVIITATINVPTATTAASVQTVLSSKLGTAATASAALGITVESDPTMIATEVQQESSDSGLTDGEVAGVAIGAAIGGIVLLGAVGLILRSIMFKEAKPVFTCLEKAPAKSPA